MVVFFVTLVWSAGALTFSKNSWRVVVDKVETNVVDSMMSNMMMGAMNSNVLIYRYTCKRIILERSPTRIDVMDSPKKLY